MAELLSEGFRFSERGLHAAACRSNRARNSGAVGLSGGGDGFFAAPAGDPGGSGLRFAALGRGEKGRNHAEVPQAPPAARSAMAHYAASDKTNNRPIMAFRSNSRSEPYRLCAGNCKGLSFHWVRA